MPSYTQKPKRDKFILGITGNIACGKSTVAGMFKTKGCLLIDADCLAHQFLAAGTGTYRKIRRLFGSRILKKDKSIDREKLGKIVFSDAKALAGLNRILHPQVIKKIKSLISSSDKKIIILDAALIVEAGLKKMLDKLVLVTASKSRQLFYAGKGMGLTAGQVKERLKFQISQKAKRRFADFIIDNNGSIEKTKKQVLEIRRKLWKS